MEPEVAPVLRSAFHDLARRKLAHWALAYLAGAWLLLQVLDLLAQPFAWPALVMRAATVVLAVGFFAALVIAWYHGEKGAQRVSGVELLMLGALLIVAGAAVALVGRRVETPPAAAGTSPSPGGLASASPAGSGQPTGAGPAAAPASSAVATSPGVEQGSIAVLPFVNMSSDSAQEYFSDGVTEELLNALSQLPELRVVSRTSAFAYKGSRVPLDSIARALRVAHVLEGSVRRADHRVRITAQLIDARTGYHLWSEDYDRELRDVFAVQDEIAHAIVRTLQVKLEGERAAAPLAREETGDPEAHALVLRALQLLRPYTQESTIRAAALLRQAIARDSSYARAYAELGRVYSYQASVLWGPREQLFSRARDLARRALAIGPELAETEYVLGYVAEYADWDFRAAEAHYRRALALNPGYARVHSLLGLLLIDLGRRDEALSEGRRAVELDPLDPGITANLGLLYTYVGQYERARETYAAALALTPDDPLILANAAANLVSLGRTADAIATIERARVRAPADQLVAGCAAYVYARAGRRADALREIRAVEKVPGHNEWVLTAAYGALGDGNRVFALLNRAVTARDPLIMDIGIDPMLEPYRRDPRMRKLLDRIGLP